MAPATKTTTKACATCGIPLDDDGWPDLQRIDEFEASAGGNMQDAYQADHDDVQTRLASAEAELKVAKKRGDEQAALAHERQTWRLRERLAATSEALAAFPARKQRITTGDCEACGTPFRGGAVDRQTVEHAMVERARTAGYVDALRNERLGYEYRVRIAQEDAERAVAEKDVAKVAGAKADLAKYEDRLKLVDLKIRATEATAAAPFHRAERRGGNLGSAA